MATPLFVAFVPMLALPASIEWLLLLASACVAALALVRGGRVHRRRAVWALAVMGVAIWALSLFGIFEPLPEELTSPVGGFTLAGGLLWNGRLVHQHLCERCADPSR